MLLLNVYFRDQEDLLRSPESINEQSFEIWERKTQEILNITDF